MQKKKALYGYAALGLLAVEIAIGRWMHDGVVRPYGGDFLVVMLLYCAGRWLTMAAPHRVAGAVLFLAYAVEIAQGLGLPRWLGWERVPLLRVLLGSRFAWGDLLAYTLGMVVVLIAERLRPSAAIL